MAKGRQRMELGSGYTLSKGTRTFPATMLKWEGAGNGVRIAMIKVRVAKATRRKRR